MLHRTKIKIINSNKKMNDWRLQLAEDLKIASKNVEKMRNKVFSYDAIIAEFKRTAAKDLQINNYELGIDTSGIYFLDNKKNKNYLFLIIKTDELVPVDNNTKNWETITVNSYLMSLLQGIINEQVEQLSYELKITKNREKELNHQIDSSLNYLDNAISDYKKTVKAGFEKVVDEVQPANFNMYVSTTFPTTQEDIEMVDDIVKRKEELGKDED